MRHGTRFCRVISVCCLLVIVSLCIYVFSQLWEVFSHYLFKCVSSPPPVSRSQSLGYTHWVTSPHLFHSHCYFSSVEFLYRVFNIYLVVLLCEFPVALLDIRHTGWRDSRSYLSVLFGQASLPDSMERVGVLILGRV